MKMELSALATQLLKSIQEMFLNSGDFNGFHLHGELITSSTINAAIELLEKGVVEVISGQDFPNMHIRPWKSVRTVREQVLDLNELQPDDYGLCLYPTEMAMNGVALAELFDNAPFQTAMARCKGATLEPAYFSTDVLEAYRNDARYRFNMGDFGVDLGISDEAYSNEEEPDKDKVSLVHLGFAYDFSKSQEDSSEGPIIRRVVAFYGDLDDLTSEHQQRWSSYQVPSNGLVPHPVWYRSQMGEWIDGIGPFGRLGHELGSLNDLFERVWGEKLFSTSRLPDEFGWILRPDQREWDSFIHLFDKLLSENLRHAAFDAAGVPKKGKKDPQRFGTIKRLHEFMVMNRVEEEVATWGVKPLREVRAARQRPAHALRNNVTDLTLVRKQKDLLRDVNEVLINLREWLSIHPKNQGWTDRGASLKDYFL